MKSPYAKGARFHGGKSRPMPQEDYEDEVETGPISLLDLAEMPSSKTGLCEYCGAKTYPIRVKSMRGCCQCLPVRIAEKAMERFIAGAA